MAALAAPNSEIAVPRGRPTKYDPSFCDLVIEDMSRGLSLTAFAGGIAVDRATIDDWRKAHPDFLLACKKGISARARYLETGLLERDMPGPAINARRFALVNAAPDEWREKVTQEHTGPDGGPVQHQVIHLVEITGKLDDIT